MYELLDEEQLFLELLKNNFSKKRVFSDDFKYTIVYLFLNGWEKKHIEKQYQLPRPLLNKWISQYKKNKGFKVIRRKTLEERQLIELKGMIKGVDKSNKELHVKLDTLLQSLNDKDKFNIMKADILLQCLILNLSEKDKITIVNKNKETYTVTAVCDLLGLATGAYYNEVLKSGLN